MILISNESPVTVKDWDEFSGALNWILSILPIPNVAEGVEAFVPYKGTVTDILTQITGGIRSGLSYCGGHTIQQMQENAEFIKMSGAGFAESKPHDVDLM